MNKGIVICICLFGSMVLLALARISETIEKQRRENIRLRFEVDSLTEEIKRLKGENE